MSDTNEVPPENRSDANVPQHSADISETEQLELQRLDALILTGRERPLRTESLRELKWLLYLTILLLIAAITSYLVLPMPDRRKVALMASIAGGVISAWGGVRGVLTARSGGISGIGWIYAVFFGGLAIVFSVLFAGLLGWLDGK